MIPPFNHNNVLPPYLGADPSKKGALSPYKCTIMEFCQRFATSEKRISILKDFVTFRLRCYDVGIRVGFQWIDGSFIEDIKARDNREPNDIDVVSFVFGFRSNPYLLENIKRNLPEFLDHVLSKAHFQVDHYPMEADCNPMLTIEMVKYWNQLFGHNKIGVWKGMVEIPFCKKDNTEDVDALKFLNTL